MKKLKLIAILCLVIFFIYQAYQTFFIAPLNRALVDASDGNIASDPRGSLEK